MRRFDKGKEYILMDDLLFMNFKKTDSIPSSLWKKVLNNDVTKLDENEDLYVELNTEEEKEFVSGLMYIYNKNYLDILSIFQLNEEVDSLSNELERISMEKGLDKELFEKRKKKVQYMYNSLLDYINVRIIDCCDTCENKMCEIEPSRRVGLDGDGHPVGYECPNHMNRLKKLKKYTLN